MTRSTTLSVFSDDVFTDAELRTLVGFLGGYSGLTRDAYALDLAQFAQWCHDRRVGSYATAALAAGVPVKVVSQRVGHADVGVTLRGYAHVMPGDDEDAALRADSLIAPSICRIETGADSRHSRAAKPVIAQARSFPL